MPFESSGENTTIRMSLAISTISRRFPHPETSPSAENAPDQRFPLPQSMASQPDKINTMGGKLQHPAGS
jgi:hypothetical protein